MDYRSLTGPELIQALEMAGRAPELALIRACLPRRAELTPALLDLLATPPDPDWDENDPRQYSAIHAGHLLIYYREPQAVPIFMRLLRDPDNEYLLEWFAKPLASYGLGILPAVSEVLNDPKADDFLRIEMTALLEQVAAEFPTERGMVTDILASALPRMDKNGKLEIPRGAQAPNDVWSFIASSLAVLHDTNSRSQIQALYRGGWINKDVMGDESAYLNILTGTRQPHSEAFNLIETYENLQQETQPAIWDDNAQAELRAQLNQLNPPHTPPATSGAKNVPAVPPASIPEFPSEPDMPPAPRRRAAPPPESSASQATSETAANVEPVRRESPKVGRNDPCPCGSGRKYKHCHGKP